MGNISQVITDFVTQAIEAGGWMELDRIYLQNKVMALIGEKAITKEVAKKVTAETTDLLDQLIDQALKNEIIREDEKTKEIFLAELADILTPPPSVVNTLFAEHYAQDKVKATSYFHQLCKTTNYIKERENKKNRAFTIDSEYGTLEITINLAKPEKDPKDIVSESLAERIDYPKCMLCMENEGYQGRVSYPARKQLRIVRMNLDGESWGFQYSPYAYFNEHSIFLAEEHRSMKITKKTFERLLTIVEIFPHYFVVSNADLPIVGGSILSHDHYQGGRHTFPMAKAPVEYAFSLTNFPEIEAGILKWPMSVIRLKSNSREQLAEAAEHILEYWQNYDDRSIHVVSCTADGEQHHTLTPIARMGKDGQYELDLVLRDNNTSEEYPDGIFHPRPEFHHIKKENIGLIEVMGLAILPPRLHKELIEVKKYLINHPNQIEEYHIMWADDLKKSNQITENNVEKILHQDIGKIFINVLEDAGVFKWNQKGQEAFRKFLKEL